MDERLKKVFAEIVYNEEISRLYEDYLRGNLANNNSLYKPLFQFQENECAKNGTPLEQAGFQIGEPWNGDIENAPILFLSSNPAYDFYEISPRYYVDFNKKTKRIKKFFIINAGQELKLDDLIEIHINAGQELKLDDLIEIQKTRIQKSFGDGLTLCKTVWNNLPQHVSYWGCVRERTELLLPDALKNYWKDIEKLSARDYARKIMKYAVCMEIVPFRSTNDGILTTAILDDCYEKFTKTILELSGASIIVLVGDKVLKTIVRRKNLTDAQEKTLINGGSLKDKDIKFGSKKRVVVYVPFNQGTIYRFENCLQDSTIKELRNILC